MSTSTSTTSTTSTSPTLHSPRFSPYTLSLLSGALAGMTVDLTLHPLDTLKTRLQSPRGLLASGGFRHIYSGVLPVLLGSAPGASLFFITYDTLKRHLPPSSPYSHMLAASVGEVAACLVRVPTEVVKQRAQAGGFKSSMEAVLAILRGEGKSGRGRRRGMVPILKEFYTGWSATLLREIPFTMIQFPLWEFMKAHPPHTALFTLPKPGDKDTPMTVSALESSVFGSFAGAVAALATTPLDVLKTRIMLAKKIEEGGGASGKRAGTRTGVISLGKQIVQEEGWKGLMKGWAPRVMWISVGGAIFLGAYDLARGILEGI